MKKKLTKKSIGVGLVGLGTVGTGVAKILLRQANEIEKKTGVRFVLKKICVKSLAKKRDRSIPRALLTSDVPKVVSDPSVDILVELIGGIHPAKHIISSAFARGKHVVTANKALLAEKGGILFHEADKYRKELGIEGSVCGGIPIIKSLKEGLVSNTVSHFLGIVNGTCNFILTSMSQEHMNFEAALAAAQKRGYAEKNPGLDIDGTDSAHKLAILARLAFGSDIPFKSIFVEGIRNLSVADIDYAKELGYAIKLLAIGKKLGQGLELRVHPTLLPLDHPLSNVRGVYNAVFIHGDQAGDLLFYGKGAGSAPSASAVMSDLVDIAKKISGGNDTGFLSVPKPGKAKILPIENLISKFYLRFQVEDRPGVLGRIALALGKNHISISSVHQKESHDSKSVPVIILTYEATEKNLRRALKEIDSKKEIGEKTTVFRMES